jgi:Domain of unknown function (DUF1844)
MRGMSDEERKETQEEDDYAIPLPPPTFEFLVISLRAQAEMQLGLMHLGEEKSQPELPLARHTIDLMSILLEKTRGNLSLEEQRLLENSLTELRFRFVQISQEAAQSGARSAASDASAQNG